jgi:hypothetical protein
MALRSNMMKASVSHEPRNVSGIRIRAMSTRATPDRIEASRTALIVYDACRRALTPADPARRAAMRPVLDAWVALIGACRARTMPQDYVYLKRRPRAFYGTGVAELLRLLRARPHPGTGPGHARVRRGSAQRVIDQDEASS